MGQSKACMSEGEAWWDANTGMSPLPQMGWAGVYPWRLPLTV